MNKYYHISDADTNQSIGVICVNNEKIDIDAAYASIVNACSCHYDADIEIKDFYTLSESSLKITYTQDDETYTADINIEETWLY